MLDKLVEWTFEGLDVNAALAQPVTAYKLRHIKMGIHMATALCSCDSFLTFTMLVSPLVYFIKWYKVTNIERCGVLCCTDTMFHVNTLSIMQSMVNRYDFATAFGSAILWVQDLTLWFCYCLVWMQGWNADAAVDVHSYDHYVCTSTYHIMTWRSRWV